MQALYTFAVDHEIEIVLTVVFAAVIMAYPLPGANELTMPVKMDEKSTLEKYLDVDLRIDTKRSRKIRR